MRALSTSLACCLLTVAARAQCLDWSSAFGPSGAGIANGYVGPFVVHDDGTGPALYAATGTSMSVARWTGSGWAPLGGTFQYTIHSLLPFDDGTGTKLYAGGSFNVVEGQPALRIASWDGNAWTQVGGGADSQVSAMCVFDDGGGPALYVAGAFTHVGGVAANRIARWDGTNWTPLGTGFNGHAWALAVHDDGTGAALYAGGEFSTAGGSPAVRIARWNGTTWSAVGAGVGGGSEAALSLLSVGNTLYAGGRFQIPGQGAQAGVARWNGSAWTHVGAMNGRVRTLALFDDGSGVALHAGGDFDSANGNPSIQRVAKWDGALWQPLGTGVCCGGFPEVLGLQSWNYGSGTHLFVGGHFTTAGGKPSSNVGVWGLPCTAPVITQQPQDATAQFPDPVVVSVQASGTAPVSYQWRKNGNPLIDGGSVVGSLTPTLSLTSWTFNDAGNYDCQISNGLGSVTSNVAVVTVPAGGTSGHPVPVTQIITYPTPVPNSPGDTYTGLIQAYQSSTNEVVVGARLNGGSCSSCGESSFNIWQGGVMSLLYRPWQQVPGLPVGVSFGIVSPTVGQGLILVGQGGSSVFTSPLLGPGVTIDNDRLLYYRDSGVELPVVREGDPAPGMPVGSTFPTANGLTRMSDDGHVAFFAQAYIGAAYQGNGFWCWDAAGGVVPLANTTMAAPGMGSNFSDLTSGIALNATGETAFLGGYAGNASYAIFRGTPGSLQAVVAAGDPVPNVPNGTFAPGGNIALNDAGDLAFNCQVVVPGQANRFAVYTHQQGTLSLIALQGDPAPGTGPGANLFVVSPLAVFPSGNVLLYASLTSNNCSQSPCPNAAIYMWKQGTLIPVAMNRSYTFPERPLNFDVNDISTVAANDAEQVVLQVNFYYGQTYSGVYGWTEGEGLFPIAVPGSQYETTPGQYKTVLGAGLDPLGGSSGGGAGFPPATSPNLSQAGKVMLRITFTDFTQGYYTGQFSSLQGLYFAPGTPFCAGDGTLATNCPCSNLGGSGRGCANSSNAAGARLVSSGGASVSEDGLLMIADGELPTALSILLQGNSQSASGVVFGDGVRCVAGSLKRIGSGNASGGVFQYPTGAAPSISARSATLGDPLAVGATRYYQVYYRDPNLAFCSSPPGSSFNISNGQRVTWNP